MAINNTKSNTLTNALIYTLNNKQSNLKTGLKEDLEINFNGAISFLDGTHACLCDGLDGKEVDIVGIDQEGNIKLLIEVKVNTNETLQWSQSKGHEKGKYQKFASDHNIPLLYFIPNNYDHEKLLPKKNTKTYNWDDILKVAAEYDFAFANLIVANVENVQNCVNIKLERLRARIWEVLAKVNVILTKENLCMKFGDFELDSYGNTPTFYNWIYIEEQTFLCICESGVYIAKDKNVNEENIDDNFEWDEGSQAYYTKEPIISFKDFFEKSIDSYLPQITKKIKKYLTN